MKKGLIATGLVTLAGLGLLGELALDGRLTPVAGVLPSAVHALAQDNGFICPAAQGGEAAWAEGLEVLAPEVPQPALAAAAVAVWRE